MRKLIPVLMMAFVLFTASACSKKKEEAPTSAPIYSGTTLPTPGGGQPSVPAVEGNPVAAPAKFDRSLAGTLNNSIEIQMDLTRNGNDLSGTYFYETVRETLELAGDITKDGTVVLTETTRGGNASGVFKGRLYGEELNGEVTLRFEGTWSKPNDNKTIPFALRERTFNLGGGKLISKEIKEENKQDHYTVEVSYPQIEGAGAPGFATFNKSVTGLIIRRVAEFKKNAPEAFDSENPDAQPSGFFVAYEITTANPDLISVFFDGSEYSSGAAHPNPFSWTLNYDVKNNREIKLRDLFNANAGYLQTISSTAIKTLKTRLKQVEMDDDNMIREGAGPKAENFQSWNITSKGLLFTFDPYQVAAYAAGSQEVLVPYTTLKDLLRPDTPVTALIALNSLAQ